MIKKKELFSTFVLLLLICIFVFWRSFLKNEILFPGNYLVAFFSPYSSYNEVPIANKPVSDDVFRHIYTFRVLGIDMIKHFQLPLWNPYNGSGMPLLATLNSGFLDPFNILFLILPYATAWNMYLFLQFLLVAFFTYLYCRSIDLSKKASFFTSCSFMFSGFVVARISLGAYGLGIAILPLILLIAESYLQSNKKEILILLSITVFTLIVSTHPQITLFILAFSVCYFLTILKYHNGSFSKAVFFLGFIGLGICLAAIQIVPTVELIQFANLSADKTYNYNFVVPIFHLISLMIPNYFGNIGTYNFWGKTDYVETVVSIGSIPTFFAYFASMSTQINRKLSAIKRFYLIALFLTLLLAINSPISEFLIRLHIPLITADPPSHIFLITTFSIGVLAGLGFDHLQKHHLTRLLLVKKVLPYLLFLLLILAITIGLSTIRYPCRIVTMNCYAIALRNTILECGFYIIVFFGLILSIFMNKRYSKYIFMGIIFLVVASGLYNADKFLPFSPRNTVLPRNSLFDELIHISSQGRIFGFGNANITTNLATYFKFYDPQYYHPLYIKRYGELTGYANTGQYGHGVVRGDAIINNSQILNPKEEILRSRLFSLLGVRFFIYNKKQVGKSMLDPKIFWQDGTNFIVENKSALPRVFLASKSIIAREPTDVMLQVFNPNLDLKSTVVLEENSNFIHTNTPLQGSVTMDSYTENKVHMTTVTNTQAILVLTDNFYPGWNAYIDGKQTNVYRADYAFRAIVIPLGKHQVTFAYEPTSVKIGLIITGGTALFLILMLLGIMFQNKGKIQRKTE